MQYHISLIGELVQRRVLLLLRYANRSRVAQCTEINGSIIIVAPGDDPRLVLQKYWEELEHRRKITELKRERSKRFVASFGRTRQPVIY